MSDQPSTMSITLPDAPEQAEALVRSALQEQGFGILMEIDVQATLAEKLGHEMGTYRILGACNPPLAKNAIEANPDIGAFLPCNVLLRGNDEGGTEVVAADPLAMVTLAGEALTDVAEDARRRLANAFAELTGSTAR